ncbi:hypothetical protein VN97_g8485 [Penicillium thymicola]|uniref:Uncharacterized protein n=1 Tax=Penicillium thymicola TaxID=293382 RepID=A0AAI9TCN8_PENTH|nr:hypothetical protein VN97_g8485 [Penicillium thymicola]
MIIDSKNFDQQVPRIPINAKSVGPRRGLEMKNLCLLRFSAGKGVIDELPLARPRKTRSGFVQNVPNNRILTLSQPGDNRTGY